MPMNRPPQPGSGENYSIGNFNLILGEHTYDSKSFEHLSEDKLENFLRELKEMVETGSTVNKIDWSEPVNLQEVLSMYGDGWGEVFNEYEVKSIEDEERQIDLAAKDEAQHVSSSDELDFSKQYKDLSERKKAVVEAKN